MFTGLCAILLVALGCCLRDSCYVWVRTGVAFAPGSEVVNSVGILHS